MHFLTLLVKTATACFFSSFLIFGVLNYAKFANRTNLTKKRVAFSIFPKTRQEMGKAHILMTLKDIDTRSI